MRRNEGIWHCHDYQADENVKHLNDHIFAFFFELFDRVEFLELILDGWKWIPRAGWKNNTQPKRTTIYDDAYEKKTLISLAVPAFRAASESTVALITIPRAERCECQSSELSSVYIFCFETKKKQSSQQQINNISENILKTWNSKPYTPHEEKIILY